MGSPLSLARKSVRIGMICILLFFGVLVGWAAIAPLSSAAIAPGEVVVDSNRKTIQHLEGGIVEELLVKEGDDVRAGDALVRLNETQSKARLDLFEGQYYIAKASEARLIAERDGSKKISFPLELVEREEQYPEIAKAMESQRRLFDTRRKSLSGKIKVQRKKIRQYKEEIRGLQSQATSAENQIALLREEISVVKKLLEEGNAVRPRLLALERHVAQLEGERGEDLALISRANQSIAEADLNIINLRNDLMNLVNSELKDTQLQLSDLEERIRSSSDIMDRVVITAPIDGKITGMQFHTIGGVIAPGQPIMDIVPLNDKLIIEAKVKPNDIDAVREGMEARIRLTAYRARKVPTIIGKLIYLSADRFTDEASGLGYFLARIEVNPGEIEQIDHVELYPGMPADVLIVTGERTVLSYLFDPITDSFYHAFRED
jgi:HlyD family type I secretion membrane fusion protein